MSWDWHMSEKARRSFIDKLKKIQEEISKVEKHKGGRNYAEFSLGSCLREDFALEERDLLEEKMEH